MEVSTNENVVCNYAVIMHLCMNKLLLERNVASKSNANRNLPPITLLQRKRNVTNVHRSIFVGYYLKYAITRGEKFLVACSVRR